MIKFLLFILCGFALTSDQNHFVIDRYLDNQYTINYSINSNLNIENKGEYKSIGSSSGYTSIIGMPKLPTYSTAFMLDPLKEYSITYEVLSSRVISDIKVIPNQHIENGLEKEVVSSLDYDFYNSDRTYPYVNVSMSEPMILRDMVVSYISVVPFKYSPSLNELEVYDSIQIKINEVGVKEDIRKRDLPKSRVFENIYKNSIINYDQSSGRNDEYQNPSVLYIFPDNLDNNGLLQQLIGWRRLRGYTVYTASLSQTGTTTSSIKNYILNAYQNFSTPPEYVTLIGDVNGSYSLPTYYEDYSHDGYGNQCEGDHPYSQLDGNDLLPEVLISRMSIQTESELSAVVFKIMNYEKATYLGSLDNYYEKAALFGDTSQSGNSCAITNEVIDQLLENHGFEDVYLKTSGGAWPTSMINELEDGALFFNYRGYLNMSEFYPSNVDDAANGYKLPFATVLTCGTGSFSEDNTCMSEKFFRAGTATNPRGGVAAIGTATWNTHTLFNNIVNLGIYQGLLADNVETAGAALASGKLALLNTYPSNPYQWISAFTHWNNLMGDGPTHLWTDTPEVITVEHPSQVAVGTNFLTVTVKDASNNPVKDAFVTLLGRFSVLPVNLFTDENGEATFNLSNFNNSLINITVTKNNCKPYLSSITVNSSGPSVNLSSSSGVIVNDNNDGIATSGETIGLSIPLTNFGTNLASSITATLSSGSNKVSILTDTISYGDIDVDETVYGSDFNLSIDSSAIQNEDLDLKISVSDDEGSTWESLIDVDILGSYLIPIDFESIQPGQTQNININLINQGSLNASNVYGTLSFQGNLITVNDEDGVWGNINSGLSINSTDSFNITASSDIVNGTVLNLQLRIQDDNGYDKVETVSLRVGNVSMSDPLGPDSYGYYIYDSGDVTYDLAPSYDWIDISSTGTNLDLSNSGDGNWSGNGPLADVNLPFTFTFYGIDYNSITVCTNGWITFGSSDSEAFRNYPIPGAGGPSPMVAAFWDDLETGNNGDVFVYSSNEYVIVQWDDMRTNFSNSLETFQMILYNDSNQPYGDNSIKIQYDEFNNTSTGNFNAYPPIHGSYSTIGIENHLADDGLQYTYYNEYPTAAMTLEDNTAIYITTQVPVTLPVPDLNVSDSSISISVNSGSTSTYPLVLSNNGESGSELTYTISQSYPNEAPFITIGGGPDAFGYYWSDSNISSDVDYDWIDIEGVGTQVSFQSNLVGTEMIDIGFDFSLYGETYSQFLINPNGWIGFEQDNETWYNTNLPSADYPTAAIFGFWDDLNPINDDCNSTCAGNVYYHSNSERLVVWYNNVAHWSSDGYEDSFYDFQIVIFNDNSINVNIKSIEGNFSATVGLQDNSGTIFTQVDQYNGEYFGNTTSYRFVKPLTNNWMSLSSDGSDLSGSLFNGESLSIDVNIDASDISEGLFDAQIDILTNVGDIFIPVNLTVVNDLGLLGDLNNDTSFDITDIILLVNIIIDASVYNYNGDLNQDGSNDVIDIVQLVSIILNN